MQKNPKNKRRSAKRGYQVQPSANLLISPSTQAHFTGLKNQDYFLRWGPAIAYMAFIYLLSDQPKNGGIIPDFGDLDFFIKKLAHFLEYGLLALLLMRAVRGIQLVSWRQLIWVFTLTVLYAATDEYHQTLVPGRAGRWQDVIIDASGALLALAIGWRFLWGGWGRKP